MELRLQVPIPLTIVKEMMMMMMEMKGQKTMMILVSSSDPLFSCSGWCGGG
jgi:hypothetical protein